MAANLIQYKKMFPENMRINQKVQTIILNNPTKQIHLSRIVNTKNNRDSKKKKDTEED